MIAQPDSLNVGDGRRDPPRTAPIALPPARAWRWCLLVTWRDYRHSVRAGRAISRPNLLRLFERRWRDMERRRAPLAAAPARDEPMAAATSVLVEAYTRGRLPR